MSGNSIAISRELVAAGVEKKTADAVAEAIVKYSYQSGGKNSLQNLDNSLHRLEVQFAEYRAEMKAFRAETRARFNFLIGLALINLFGVYAVAIPKLFGG